MSYRVKRLTVGKGRTIGNEKNGEWIREYYELELEIPDESELQIAKENVVSLLNEWLGIAETEEKPARWDWNPQGIRWVEVEGFKGKYERYPVEGSKVESTPDYQNLLKDLKAHDGKLSREGCFYWLFQDGSTVGRKRRG